MQSETFQPETYFCRQCYVETKTTNPACPECGIKMKTLSEMKTLGKLLAVLGSLLTVILGMCLLLFLGALLFGKFTANQFSVFAGASA